MSPFLLESWRSFLLSICQFSPVNVLYFLLYIFLRVNLTFVEKNYLSFLEYMQFVSVWARFPCKFDSFSSFPSEICSSV